MTDIEQKALALIIDAQLAQGSPMPDYLAARTALCRAIEQHEAFRQEVSEAATKGLEAIDKAEFFNAAAIFSRFIIAKPDPLVEAAKRAWPDISAFQIEQFREAFEHFGYEIREKAGE